jgi:CheY-like chemotaxis protein
MPKMTGLELLREAKRANPDAVGIILTAFTDVDVLIEAINLGQVYRYITKPWDAKEVRGVMQYAIERFHLQRENSRLAAQLAEYTGYLNQQLHGEFDFGNIIGESSALARCWPRWSRSRPPPPRCCCAARPAPARSWSPTRSTSTRRASTSRSCASTARRSRPASSRASCSATRRAASPARWQRRPGRFELADGGTLFLDEVGDLPMEVQIKLLRTLQEREFERVGGTETIKVDVRLVSATNRNLEKMIEDGEFREDLYYRLNVFPINLPPLRDRLEDLPRADRSLHREVRAPDGRPAGAGRARRAREAARVQLARQRARAREHHRARDDPREAGRRSAPRTSTSVAARNRRLTPGGGSGPVVLQPGRRTGTGGR